MKQPNRQFFFGRGSKVTVAPVSEPISTAEAKNWLKVSFSDDDALIASLVKAARMHIESRISVKMITQTVQEVWDDWPYPDEIKNQFGGFSLEWWPVQSITSVSYIDEAGDTQVISPSNYVADLVSRPCRIEPAEGYTFPLLDFRPNAVIVVYEAGYSSAALVPDDLKLAMYKLIGEWYDNRADQVRRLPTAVDAILNEWKPEIYI